MAIQKVSPSDKASKKPEADFPLLKDFYRSYPDCLGIPFTVVSVGTSSTGKWIWADTEVFRFMIPADSGQAKDLLALLPQLHNKVANALVVVPEKTRKGISAYLGIDDAQPQMLYLWDGENQALETRSKEEMEAQKKRKTLSLENMGIQP